MIAPDTSRDNWLPVGTCQGNGPRGGRTRRRHAHTIVESPATDCGPSCPQSCAAAAGSFSVIGGLCRSRVGGYRPQRVAGRTFPHQRVSSIPTPLFPGRSQAKLACSFNAMGVSGRRLRMCSMYWYRLPGFGPSANNEPSDLGCQG